MCERENNMTESITENDVTVTVYPAADRRRRKKKSGAFGIFKAALNMMRKRKSTVAKPDHGEGAANPNWTKLVGSMRPMHLQETVESPAASPEVSSSRGAMSHYSSVSSLLDLDNSSDEEEEEDPDEAFDALTGDEMIDAKADEFIAQFYKQLQLQKTARYHQRSRG